MGKDFIKVIQEYKDTKGYHVYLHYKVGDDGVKLVQLHCIIVGPQHLELMNTNPAFFHVICSDQTHCTTTTAIHLGAITGLIPNAGGKPLVAAITLWLPGCAELEVTDRDLKDKTIFMEKCSLFFYNLYEKGFLKVHPRIRITMTDKDLAAVNGSHLARKVVLKKNQLLYENSILASLAALAQSASDEEIAAAGKLISSLPLFVGADGILHKHDKLPIDRNQLFSEYRNTSPLIAEPLNAYADAAFDVLFRRTWLDSWGPGIMRGLSYHVKATLTRCTALLLDSPNHGAWNIAAMQLLWLECPSYGLLSSYILDACLVFAVLCIWHAKKSVEKAVNNHIVRDCALRRSALDGLYAVFAGTMSAASYKEMWHVENKWIKYVEDNWLCEKWFSLIYAPMRKLMNTLWKDCDNDSEIFFSILKHEHQRSSDLRALLKKLIGAPDAAAGIDRRSISGLQLMDLEDMLNHMDSYGQFRRRDYMFNAVQALGDRWSHHEAGTALRASPLVVAERFFDFNVTDSQRNYTVGLNTGGMMLFTVPDAVPGDHLATMNTSAKNMSRQQHLLLEHLGVSAAKNVDSCGTNKSAILSINSAIQCAKDAASSSKRQFSQPLTRNSVASPLEDLAHRAAALAACAHEFKIFFGADPDGIVLLNRIESGLQYATPELVQLLLSMLSANHTPSSVPGIDAATSNQNLRTSILAAHPAVGRNHFKDVGADGHLQLNVPHFGVIYIIIITMSAQDWHKECLRVQGGNFQSLQFRGPLSIGYLIALNSVYSMCSSLVSVGNNSEPISAFYVGQELRRAHSSGRLGRIKEHGTSNGSANISELYFIHKDFLCTPLGNVQMENRILAFLPPDAVTVDTMEAVFLLILLAIPGFISFNDSPTGQIERFLKPSFNDHPAQMHAVCAAYIASLGGIAVVERMNVGEVEWPWLGRALRGVDWLLHAGLYKNGSGTRIAAAFPASMDHPKAFSVLQCIDGLLDGVSSRKCTVSLWCMGCDCDRKDVWCEHLIISALRENREGRPAISESPTLLFFIPTPRDAISQQQATIGVRRSAVLNAPERDAIAPEKEVSADDLSLKFGVAVTGLQNWFTSVRGDFRGLPNALLKAIENVCRTYKMFINHINDPDVPSFSGSTRSTRRMCNSDDIAERKAIERAIAAPEMGQVDFLERMIMYNRAVHGSTTFQPLASQVLYIPVWYSTQSPTLMPHYSHYRLAAVTHNTSTHKAALTRCGLIPLWRQCILWRSMIKHYLLKC